MLKKGFVFCVACMIMMGVFGQSRSSISSFNPLQAFNMNVKEGADSSKRGAETSIEQNIRQTLGYALESFLPFQFKYAILLNESVEKLTNVLLYKTIDEWFGTRYRYGGTTTKGIDCSAFMQVLGGYAFGWMLPRTAREQFYTMARISPAELKEGDFVFFNTRGGISHVGMYLSNNKFVHSSSTLGVSISDLTDKYWSARFLGARRIANATMKVSLLGAFQLN
jgi:lipoprotein Spr